MASVPQVRGEGDFWAGLATTGSIPQSLLDHGMDNLGMTAFITRGDAKFMADIHKRWPKAKSVGTREHRSSELWELERTIPVTVGSGSANAHSTFGIPNSIAGQLQPNDILFHAQLYMSVQGTGLVWGQVNWNTNTVPTPNSPLPTKSTAGIQVTGATYTRVFGPDASSQYNCDHEQILVLRVGAPNSAGAGNTLITVRRGFTGAGPADFGGGVIPQGIVNTAVTANSDSGAIVAGDYFLTAHPAWPEGTGPARGFHKNQKLDNNFTQEFKYAVEITKESKIQKHYGGKDALEINRMLRLRAIALNQERSYLWGRKGKETDGEGRLRYTMGGVLEFVPKDVDHFHRYSQPTITFPGWLDVADRITNQGGSTKRTLYTGKSLYTTLKKAFHDSGMLRTTIEDADGFDIKVDTLVGAGAEFRVVPLWTFEEAGWGMRALCVDDGYPHFIPVTHPDWDMKYEGNIQLPGEQIYKEQWVGIKGLERRYSQYLHIISFE